MNRKLLLLTAPIVLGLIFSLSLISTPSITTQNISDEQAAVNAQLIERGMEQVDGVWYSEGHFYLEEKIAEYEAYTKANNLPYNPPMVLGGILTVDHYDSNQNLLSTQSVHNRVPDEGEDFMITQIFKDGNTVEVEADLMASICVSARVGFVDTSEAATASDFDTNDNLGTVDNCIEDTTVAVASQVATISVTFDAPTHVPDSTTITGIAVCQGTGSGSDPTPFKLCQESQATSGGKMLAIIDISDVTLLTSETVVVTYNFDASSSGS